MTMARHCRLGGESRKDEDDSSCFCPSGVGETRTGATEPETTRTGPRVPGEKPLTSYLFAASPFLRLSSLHLISHISKDPRN